MPLRLITREQWGAEPADWVIDLEETPVPVVVLKYFTFTKQCHGDDQCHRLMRKLQLLGQQDLGFPDIEYNFMVVPDGTVYEGRGWLVSSTGYHDFDRKSIDIAYIGDYRREDPPPEMVQGAKDLIEFGVQNNYIKPDYHLETIRFWHSELDDYGFRSPLEEDI